MSYLIDTNLLLRLVQDTHPMHNNAAESVKALLDANEEVDIIPQNLIEFWAVATRPTIYNGLGLSLDETEHEITGLKSIFALQLDVPSIYFEWEKLVKAHGVSGRQVHNARLVAAMLTHKINNLLTFNIDDFKRYNEIRVVDPAKILNP